MTETEQIEKRGGRPRDEGAHRAIIEATLELLAEVGVAGTSIEGIAARAAVGKTTIYRRWTDKESLICDAMAMLKGPLPKLPGTSLRDDLLTLVESAVHARESARNRRLYACFIGEMSRYPALNERFRRTVIKPRRDLTRDTLRRAVERGELRDDLDVDVMIDIVVAPPLSWMLNHPDDAPPRWLLEQLIDGVLGGLRR
jgi:AcrR family transcriptional regulator